MLSASGFNMVDCAITPSSVRVTFADHDRRRRGELAPDPGPPASAGFSLATRRTARRSLPTLALGFVIALQTSPASMAAGGESLDYTPTRAEIELLDDVQWRAVRFFLEHSDPRTGLTQDRARTDGTASQAPP